MENYYINNFKKIKFIFQSIIFLALNSNIVSQTHCANYFIKISAEKSEHCLAIKNDGTLWAWGRNDNGQLGDGTNVNTSNPIQIGNNTNWLTVSAGGIHSLAIKNDGTLWAWGKNDNGQLGDGTTVSKSVPTQIGSATNWNYIYAGPYQSFGITTEGKLWAWGYNANRALGDGTNTQRNSPVQIGISTNWSMVTTSGNTTLALTNDGKLWGWAGGYGALGNGTTGGIVSSPIQIGTANWITVSAGTYHSLGIKSDGTLWSWGTNFDGQLGNSSINTTVESSPIQIGTSNNWVAVKAGNNHSLGMTSEGNIWGWGDNKMMEITNSSSQRINISTQIGSSSIWTKICAGNNFNIALDNQSNLYSWGENYSGQLGIGSTACKSIPNLVSSFSLQPTNVNIAPNTNTSFTSLVNYTGYSYQWQVSTDGGLNFVDLTDDETYLNSSTSTLNIVNALSDMDNYKFRCRASIATCSTPIYSLAGTLRVLCIPFNKLSEGSYAFNSHALTIDGKLWTWGKNYNGQLADGEGGDRNIPFEVSSPTNWTTVIGGYDLALGITSDGKLWGWGNLNYERNVNSFLPVLMSTMENWTKISGNFMHYLGITADGKLWAWGANTYGELGIGSTNSTGNVPNEQVQVGTGTNWTTVSAGYDYSLAITNDGKLWAWGRNNGRFGNGGSTDSTVPIRIGLGTNWSMIKAGASHSLGITTDGKLYAWGNNSQGQLGDGTTTAKSLPTQIGTNTNWISASPGYNYSIGLTSDGKLWAWGVNSNGQLGDGTNINKNVPTQIGTNTNWVSAIANGFNSMALNSNGELWTWGYNIQGQLGDGTNVNKSSPVLVNGSCQTLSITVNEIKSEITLYPNPNNGHFEITFGFKQLTDNTEIYIYNLLGQIIYKSKILESDKSIDISGNPNGIYICKIIRDKKIIKTEKIIIN